MERANQKKPRNRSVHRRAGENLHASDPPHEIRGYVVIRESEARQSLTEWDVVKIVLTIVGVLVGLAALFRLL